MQFLGAIVWALVVFQVISGVFSASIGGSDGRVLVGDILYSEEQFNDLLANNLASKDKLWPRQYPEDEKVMIPYRIYENSVNVRLLELACDAWEKNTCIDFYDMDQEGEVKDTHIKVITSQGCLANLGYTRGSLTEVSLGGDDCVFVGLMHEFGHALGMQHEQSRSDRDEHLMIAKQNIAPGDEAQFTKEKTVNYGIPYDYMSAMQYGQRAGGKDGKRVMLARDARFQDIFGDFKMPSFMNYKLVNIMYGCIDRWKKRCKKTDADCKNGGYVNENCGCNCPAGTKGRKCEKYVDSYNDALLKQLSPYSVTINKTGSVVATPGFPSGPNKGLKLIQVLQAPKCHKAVMTFEEFRIDDRNKGECAYDRLEVRTDVSVADGQKYCGAEIQKGKVLKSDKQTLILQYYNYDYESQNQKNPNKGYNGTFTTELISGCS